MMSLGSVPTVLPDEVIFDIPTLVSDEVSM